MRRKDIQKASCESPSQLGFAPSRKRNHPDLSVSLIYVMLF